MATTSWKGAGSEAVYAAHDYSVRQPENALVDNSSYANWGTGGAYGTGDEHEVSGFGFTTSDVPEGATIDGIEVALHDWYSSKSWYTNSVGYATLHTGGTTIGTAKTLADADLPHSAGTTWTLGGATDVWGSSIDDADVRSADFGITLQTVIDNEWIDWRVYYIEIRVHYTEGSSDTEVTAAAEGLTLTPYAAGVALNVETAVDSAALTITTQAAAITHDIDVQVDAAALSLTPAAAAISKDANVEATPSVLALATVIATITHNSNVAVDGVALNITPHTAVISTEAATIVEAQPVVLSFAPQAATISHDVGIAAASNALTLTARAASIETPVDVAVSAGTLTLTPLAASVVHDVVVSVAAATLTITPFTVMIFGGNDVSVAAVPLSLTPLPATIHSDIEIFASDPAALSIVPLVGDVDIDFGIPVAAGSLTLTPNTAAVANDVEISATTVELFLYGVPAGLGSDINVYASAGDLGLGTFDAGVTGLPAAVVVWIDAGEPGLATLNTGDKPTGAALAITRPTGVDIDQSVLLHLDGDPTDAEI